MSAFRAADEPVATWRDMLKEVSTPAGTVAVHDTGSGHPVVMLHGIPTHAFLWRDVARIVSLNQRAIAPDLIGFGFSDKPEDADLSPQGQADAVLGVLRELGVDTFTLVSHDYGALVAAEIVSREPQRVERLVITNTSLSHSDWSATSPLNPLTMLKVPIVGEAALTVAQPLMLKAAFAIYVSERHRLTDETMALYWHPFENGFDQTLLRLSRESQLDEDAFHRWKAALYDFQRPALVVWGALDPSFRLDRAHEIVRLLPDCRFEAFKHSNHFIQEDRPQALARLMAAFVEGRYDG